MLNSEWEPKIPEDEIILRQAKVQLKKGKSSGSVVDIKVMKKK